MKKFSASTGTLPNNQFDFFGSGGKEPFPSIKLLDTFEPFFVRKIPVWKRVMDITGAILGFILLFPLMLAIAVLIKLVSSGPVFFKQDRIGIAGKKFKMWKFRTMEVNADTSIHEKYISELHKNGNSMNKLENDQRIITFGNVLRKMCLDELPQLINVLRGEMSLVGPRPDPVYSVYGYHTWYRERFDSVPGITGLWQVSGKNRTTFEEMMKLDIAYSRKRSLGMDFKIILMTLPAIISNAKDNA